MYSESVALAKQGLRETLLREIKTEIRTSGKTDINLELPSYTCEGEPETILVRSLRTKKDGSCVVRSESYDEERDDNLEKYSILALMMILEAL